MRSRAFTCLLKERNPDPTRLEGQSGAVDLQGLASQDHQSYLNTAANEEYGARCSAILLES